MMAVTTNNSARGAGLCAGAAHARSHLRSRRNAVSHQILKEPAMGPRSGAPQSSNTESSSDSQLGTCHYTGYAADWETMD